MENKNAIENRQILNNRNKTRNKNNGGLSKSNRSWKNSRNSCRKVFEERRRCERMDTREVESIGEYRRELETMNEGMDADRR